MLDPFIGTGTTAEAALELGRNAIGYEINPEYKPLIDKKINKKTYTQISILDEKNKKG